MRGNARAPSLEAAPNGLALARNPHSGTGGLGPGHVLGIQRARILDAMVEVSVERGVANVTVARVVERAGVSRRTFYELYDDREECFLEAFDEVIALASRYVLDGYDANAQWVERLRTALIGLLSFVDVERGAGQLLIVGSLGAGASALERRQRALTQMIALIDEGRTETKAGAEPPLLTAEGLAGGVLSVLHARLLARPRMAVSPPPPARGNRRVRDTDGDSLLRLAGPLMGMIVLPYLGPAGARRELARPVPKLSPAERQGTGDPLRGLGMRLTYRTVRVLLSIAAAPGSSNREIGRAAGIADQGQISKLLGRLHGLGLVENEGLSPGKGAPNAWALTARGRQVEQAMTVGASPGGR